MKVATGKSILDGIAIGPLRFYHKVDTEIVMASKLTPAEELSRFATAQGKAQEQLGTLYEKALEEVARTTPPFLRSTR